MKLLLRRLLALVVYLVRAPLGFLDGLLQVLLAGSGPKPPQRRPQRRLTATTQRAAAAAGWQAVRAAFPGLSLSAWDDVSEDTRQHAEQLVRAYFLRLPPLPTEGWDAPQFNVFGSAAWDVAIKAPDGAIPNPNHP